MNRRPFKTVGSVWAAHTEEIVSGTRTCKPSRVSKTNGTIATTLVHRVGRHGMSKIIMVIDNDQRLLALVENYLGLEGFRVITACNGREALHLARPDPPQLIVLDPMMPAETDCRLFIRAYRSERALPILLLMARLEDAEQVTGLELGAVDYLIKPFRPRELLARIRLAFRHAREPEQAPKVLEAAGIVLDKGNRFVRVGPRYVDLTPSEFDLLAVLMSAPGCVLSRLDLLDVVQGVHCNGNKRLIDIHIKNLRAKIEPDPHSPRFIETVYGFGYRFCRTIVE